MSLRHCPTCGKRFAPPPDWQMPFCSPRCQTIDLGRWLGEQHALPIMRSEDDPEEEQAAEGHDDRRRGAGGE
ncbi:MAG: DNA gyrase inhibitor YacG [Planctomycetes bacterium]|nr:DNA gyrase inhibitor YacG [Planctomycetota bacterium]